VERGTESETFTNESGNYRLTYLLPGQFVIKAEAPGFQIAEVRAVSVHLDQAARVDVQLQIGQLTDSVTVSAESVPQLKTDRADVSVTFNERYILDLPVGRNFTALELLAPGTSILGFQHASSENPQAGIQINVNGQNWGETSYQLDGTDNRDPILGIIVINPTIESVTEAKITTQNYDAEFGQALAGVVSTQTKSGTNAHHGSAFGSHSGGNAASPFNKVEGIRLPTTDIYDFGGSLGGPIVKKRLFAFGDYEGNRAAVGASKRANVPTAKVRQTCLGSGNAFCDLGDYPQQIFDPATDNTIAFAGNQIPVERLSSQAIALLQLLPEPNIPDAGFSQNYLATGIDRSNNDRFNVRLDHALNDRLQYFGRYSFADFRRHSPPTFGDVAGGLGMTDGFPGQSLARNQSVAAGANYTWSPSLLTDFRFGFNRYHVNVLPSAYGTAPAKEAGIPNINFDNTFTSGLPFLGVEGQDFDNFDFGTICNCPLLETEQQFQWVSNWTKLNGNHMVKWGADIRYAQNLRVPSQPPRTGGMIFGKTRTEGPGLAGGGLGLATFLLGDVTMFARTVSSSLNAGERQKRWFFYGQDTWRLTPKFTINYGLRWEIYFPQSVTGKGQGGWLDLSTGQVRVAGYGDINLQGNVRNSLTNFAPRLGIAYALNPKTVVRMGYGRSFDLGVFGSTFGHTVTQNLPVLAFQELSPATLTGSVFSLNDGPPQPKLVVVPDSGVFKLPDQVSSYALPGKIRLPTVDAWNVTIQRAITPTFSLEAGYVANKGTHVFPGDGPIYDRNQPTIEGFGVLNLFERRPFYKKFGWTQSIMYLGSDASNNYNALQLRTEKRFGNGYQFLAHYVWSKALGYDGDYYAVDPKLSYGPSDSGRKHVFILVGVFDLPLGRHRKFFSNINRWEDWIIGGWSLAPALTVSSGLPFTPSYANCSADIDTGPCRPNLVGRIHVTGNRDAYFTTTGGITLQPNGQPGDTIGPWQRPVAGTFGTAGRNSIFGPGFSETDVNLKKSFHVKQEMAFELHASISNVFNRVNLANPFPCVDCGRGGAIFGTLGHQRDVQFHFRLQF